MSLSKRESHEKHMVQSRLSCNYIDICFISVIEMMHSAFIFSYTNMAGNRQALIIYPEIYDFFREKRSLSLAHSLYMCACDFEFVCACVYIHCVSVCVCNICNSKYNPTNVLQEEILYPNFLAFPQNCSSYIFKNYAYCLLRWTVKEAKVRK